MNKIIQDMQFKPDFLQSLSLCVVSMLLHVAEFLTFSYQCSVFENEDNAILLLLSTVDEVFILMRFLKLIFITDLMV
jgi:hypothetical protein